METTQTPTTPQPINTPPTTPQYMTVESAGRKKMIAVFVLSFLMIIGASGVFLFMYAQSSSKASEMFQYSMRKNAASISVSPLMKSGNMEITSSPEQEQTVDQLDVSDTQVDNEMDAIDTDVSKL